MGSLGAGAGCVARTAIPLANLELTAAGLSTVDFRAGLSGKSIKLVSLFLDCLKANSGPQEKTVDGHGLINTYLSSLRLERVRSAGAGLRPCQGQILS